ncbi:hypothetical protein KP509_30G062600 [Ceratopteris richardii]|uniref:Uncharacterized protein n=1 Tax=Ceratopteris richardii TaxID=49495 RepID=A0A8T2R422_CERRI|nr:hypothetical protein KP509_30G062600 [Ceratopteris richardii]
MGTSFVQHSNLCNGDIIRASSALHPVNSHPKTLEASTCEKISSCARIIRSWIGATSVIHLIYILHGTSNSTDVNKITVNSQLAVQAVLTCNFVTFLILKIITGILSPTEGEQTNANMNSSLQPRLSRQGPRQGRTKVRAGDPMVLSAPCPSSSDQHRTACYWILPCFRSIFWQADPRLNNGSGRAKCTFRFTGEKVHGRWNGKGW